MAIHLPKATRSPTARREHFDWWMGWLLVTPPVCVALFFDSGTDTTFEPDKARLFAALVMGLLALHVTDRSKADHVSGPSSWPLAGPLLILCLALFISGVVSVSQYRAFWGTYYRGQGLLFYFCCFIYLYLFYFYGTSHSLLPKLLKAVALGSIPVVLYGLVQASGRDPLAWEIEAGSFPVISTLGRSNYLASYLVVVIPLTLAYALGSDAKRERVLGISCCIVQTMVLVLTRSRAGILVLGFTTCVGLIAWGVLRHRRSFVVLGTMLGLAGLLVIITLNILGSSDHQWAKSGIPLSMSDLHRLDFGSVGARLTIWKASLKAWSQSPLVGYGIASFPLVFARFYPHELIYYQGRGIVVDHAHNALLNVAVEGGILVVLAMLCFVIMVWHQGIAYLRTRKDSLHQGTLLCCLLGLLATSIDSLVSPSIVATLVLVYCPR